MMTLDYHFRHLLLYSAHSHIGYEAHYQPHRYMTALTALPAPTAICSRMHSLLI